METGNVQRFTNYLVASGFLSQKDMNVIKEQAASENIPISAYLLKKQILDSVTIAKSAAACFQLPLYDISSHDPQFIPEEFLRWMGVDKRYALPILQKKSQLIIAAVSLDILELASPPAPNASYVIVDADKLSALIDEISPREVEAVESKKEEVVLEKPHGFQAVHIDHRRGNANEADRGFSETPVVRLLNKLILDAIKTKASDIHFEPYDKFYRVRYRKDGILYEISNPPVYQAKTIVSRLKVMADLDISEHRIPQDGRFKLTFKDTGTIDFRISTCPTMYGEKVVLRLLDPSSTALDIAVLGMDEKQEKLFMHAIQQSQGMIIVTGPTGSGKTVTLYTAMNILNTPAVNISTIEDPIEIYMEGINQVQVNPKTGMQFSTALRSFLRQDPDIIMVGEIRDLETAEIAIKAAQTGHLVLTTLHTNNAILTITRLSNMGVKPFDITSSVTLIMAQRLVRKLCPHCKKLLDKNANEYKEIAKYVSDKELKDIKIYGPGSCDKCTKGYSGRTGIFEVMRISDEMSELIMVGGHRKQELMEQAKKEGILSMAESGINKVKAGITSLEEVSRVVEI